MRARQRLMPRKERVLENRESLSLNLGRADGDTGLDSKRGWQARPGQDMVVQA